MRQVVLDTETTGLEVRRGHRVIEIGCVELLERRPTGRTFHVYLNPDRAIDEGARAVTGISDEFLLDKPRFAEIADQFIEFIEGAEIIVHNAAFDVGFLDAELMAVDAGHGNLAQHVSVLDTLALAREKYPGQRNSLDGLCKRHGVDNSHRESHGALLDAQLLAEVYLLMTAGQGDLGFGEDAAPVARVLRDAAGILRAPLRVLAADAGELAAHRLRLEAIEKASGACLWLRIESA
jgi:DNA polymerase-3 subunit epsilon